MEINRLYPQYKVIQDRRQQSVSVSQDRRSGMDRRSDNRVKLDTGLTRDIFEVRNTVSAVAQKKDIKLSQTFTGLLASSPVGRKVLNGMEALKGSQVVKEIKRADPSELKKDKLSSGSTEAVGLAGGALAGVMGTLFLGAVGAVVGLGFAVYFGSKAIKNVIAAHLKNG